MVERGSLKGRWRNAITKSQKGNEGGSLVMTGKSLIWTTKFTKYVIIGDVFALICCFPLWVDASELLPSHRTSWVSSAGHSCSFTWPFDQLHSCHPWILLKMIQSRGITTKNHVLLGTIVSEQMKLSQIEDGRRSFCRPYTPECNAKSNDKTPRTA